MDFFGDFSAFFSLLLSLSLSLSSYFPFYCAFISDFCFGLASSLRQAGFLKKSKVKLDFQNSIFYFFSAFESFLCPPSMCLKTDATSVQGHGNGTYKDINMNRIRE